MRKTFGLTLTALMLAGGAHPALAQDDENAGMSEPGSYQEPGTVEEPGIAEPGAVTTAEEAEVTGGYLKNEHFGFVPQVGALRYTDQADGTAARAAYGLTLDWGLLRSKWYAGPNIGFIFSHLGAPTSNAFGTSPDNSSASGTGSNMFFIPTDVKIGYYFSDRVRLAAHGGGNVVYRSEANSMRLSDSSSVGTESNWTYFPNVGVDFDWAIGQSVALGIRPDWTFTSGDDFYTGTITLSFLMG